MKSVSPESEQEESESELNPESDWSLRLLCNITRDILLFVFINHNLLLVDCGPFMVEVGPILRKAYF